MDIPRRLLSIAKLLVAAEQADNKEIALRQKKKIKSVKNLAENINKLRAMVRKTLKADDEKDRLTALVVAVMDKTAERVGNEDSASDGHFGITGFKKKHVTVSGNSITFKYVGKSGVDHEKTISDETIAGMLKKQLKNKKPDDFVFETDDGFKIKADRVNRFLGQYDVKSKDMRGFLSNKYVLESLSKSSVSSDEAERKKKFLEVLDGVAERVGHKKATLRTHYLFSKIEDEYIKHGKIISIKNL